MRGRVPFSPQTPAGVRKSVFPPFFALCRRIPSFLPFLRLISSPSRSVSPSAPFLCGEEAISETFIPLRRARYSDRAFLHGFGAIRTRFRFPSVGNIRFRARTRPKAFPRITFFGTPRRFVVPAFCSVSPLFRAAFHSRFPSVFAPRFPFPFLPLFRPSCNPVSRPVSIPFSLPFSVPFFAPFLTRSPPRFHTLSRRMFLLCE